jgi:Domain of unknown function (DUF5615)
VRLLLDEHYSAGIATKLRTAGYDVVTIADCGMTGADDRSVLEYAARERRALLTNNVRHFAPLAERWAAEGRDHSGVVFTSDSSLPRARATIGAYVEALSRLMDLHAGEGALRNDLRWLS